MKISLNWLRDYINIDLPVNELVKGLIDLGIEVESVEDQSAVLKNFVIGKVIERAKHPNADKLSVCKVDAGTGEILNIVCGAPNVDSGQTVCVALVGAIVPNGGFEIKKAKLRGEPSEGMICSAKELNLGDDHSGIMVLNTELPVGTPFAEYLKANDVILEIGITPNRGDLLSHIGVARELGALTGSELKLPAAEVNESGSELKDAIAVDIEDPKGCLRYCGSMVKNVKVKQSPEWLQQRLIAVGLRPINNIVDVTNYVMMECGQPLHAFDYDKIAGKKIIVKKAGNTAKFTTLDSKERKLREDILMICDAEKPVALAGIMGGENSEISDSTTNIFIESAYFDPVLTRLSSKFLGLQSDSSYRFERGVDIERTKWACKRAANLIAELGGGVIADGVLDVYPQKLEPLNVKMRAKHLSRIAGVDYSIEDAAGLLGKIGIRKIESSEGEAVFEIPQARREDLQREIDLVEEVIRLDGYEKITVPEYSEIYHDTRDFSGKEYDAISGIKKFLTGRGFKEIISNTLVDENLQKKFDVEYVSLLNPSNDLMGVLRSNLYIGLFDVLKVNFENSNNSLKLFEVGDTFSYDQEGKITENRNIMLVMAGEADLNAVDVKLRNYDIYDMIGEAEGLFEKLRVVNLKKFDYYSHNSVLESVIEYKTKNNTVARITGFSKKFLQSLNIERPVFVCEILY
ncbi:MAG: phenylalanine--tRNA ligase subunit beta [Ignavibacteria bacterium]|nr:phenylalanine--tRNA ligase subunit beta [Ignavibacteria bacterium]